VIKQILNNQMSATWIHYSSADQQN